MGLAIGIKHKGKIYLATDSIYQGVMDVESLKNPDNFNLCKLPNLDHAFLAFQGNHDRFFDLIKTKENLIDERCLKDGKLSIKYLTKHFVPKLFEMREEHQFVDPDEKKSSLSSEMILTYKSQLLYISIGGTISEKEHFIATGLVEEPAYGAYYAIDHNMPIHQLIIKIFEASLKHQYKMRFPILIADVSKESFTVISRQLTYKMEEKILSYKP